MRKMALVVALLVLATGCSKGPAGPKTVSVSGTILVDGKPMDGVEVHFVSPDGFNAYGKTGADGKYRLIQGAVAGENLIYVSKIEGDIVLDPANGMDAGQLEAAALSGQPGAAMGKVQGQVFPPDYSDPMKSKLKYTVPDGGSDSANFDIPTK